MVDLLVLRAMLRQAADVLRVTRQQQAPAKEPPPEEEEGHGGTQDGGGGAGSKAKGGGGKAKGEGRGHEEEDDDELSSFFRVTFEPQAAFLGPIPPGPVPSSASVVSLCPPSGSAAAGLLVPLARWVDVMERHLQAALAPRVPFRLPRAEQRRLRSRQSSAVASDPVAARRLPCYGDHMIKLLMKDDCDVQFHHLRVGAGHRTVQVGRPAYRKTHRQAGC